MIKNIIGKILSSLALIMPFGFGLRPYLHKLRGVHIGKNVWISKYVYIDDNHPECIFIGDNTTIGLRTIIFAHTYFGKRVKNNPNQVVIGKNVFIGPNCVILAGVKIGDGAVIKAGSVITRNIPPHTLWGPPDIVMMGEVTVPLNSENGYANFLKGLKPIRRAKQTLNHNSIQD